MANDYSGKSVYARSQTGRCMKFLLFTVLFFVSLTTVFAGRYRFRTMSPEGGFYYDGVRFIKQDKEGFIWVMMESNLYRFDGYRYKQYYSRFTDLAPSKEWRFTGMAVNAAGDFFVHTSNGLYAYDRAGDHFYAVWEKVELMTIDAFDNLWIKQADKWGIFDMETKTVFTPLFDGEEAPFYIGPITCLQDSDLYVFSNYGKIYRYNYAEKEFSYCMVLPEPDGRVMQARGHKGKLWVFTLKYGLYKIDLSSFSVEKHYDFYKEAGNVQVRDFLIDKNGFVWLGTINGLYILDPEKNEYRHYLHSRTDPFSLPNNSVWTVCEDRQKNIWLGTYSGNVCYVNLDEKDPFTTCFPRKNELNHTPVSAFAEDERFLWIGTEGGGINRMDKRTGEFTWLSHTEDANSLSFNNVKSLVIDGEQHLWIATYSGGMDCYDPKTKRFRHFVPFEKNNSLLNSAIRKIVLESDSGLWIAYQSKRPEISFYSFKHGEFTHYDFSGEEGNLTVFRKENNPVREASGFYIFDILRDRENRLWLLSNENLYLADIQKKTIKAIGRRDSTFMNFSTFCLDDRGRLWIGTNGNGLVRYDPDSGEFDVYGDLLKQGASSVSSICSDDERNIWAGTDNGLVRYDMENNTFSCYDKQDGVQGQVYYPLAAMKGIDGQLYFGGTNGFTIVRPQEISRNGYKPRIILSDFLIDNLPVENFRFSSSDAEKEIVLNHKQENFGFRFAADNYLIPEKNRFRYRLKGYDDHWIETDASLRTALYSKVPAGVYAFEVTAANNDGVWSDETAVVTIRCKPAPWLSVYAYVVYVLIVLTVAYFIFRHFNERKKLKMQLYLENVEKNKKEELHRMQLRFYTDISHDFKTPLSLILAALYKMKKEGLKSNYYDIMDSNSKRLLKLVNELMDFKTVENGKMRLKLQPVDVDAFVEKIALDFREYARERQIDFTIDAASSLPPVYIDKNVLEKIILNLLNNAFKYTKDNGSVSIKTDAGNEELQSSLSAHYVIQRKDYIPENTWSIVVRDSGIGISKESIENVFERYYRIDAVRSDPQLGTGIGLALVKSLILLHRGRLSIFSEKDRGTDIEIRFSTDERIYDAGDFLQTEPETIPQPADTDDLKDLLNKNDVGKLMKNDRRRILLVEDHADLRKLIAGILSEDYDVIEAEDGLAASKIMAERIIELVISDIMMPRKDGITFCRETKSNLETSHVPIILLTAKTGINSKIEGADSGADIYLEKPVDFNLLKRIVQNVFKQQQHLKEYYAKNYFADSADLSSNEQDNKFLKDFIRVIENNLNRSRLDVNYIASEMSMSRSKLYNKIKMMTGKSVVEFVLSQRLRKAARLMIEENCSIRQVMDEIGIESQAYFTNTFKKEFGETPAAFVAKHRQGKGQDLKKNTIG